MHFKLNTQIHTWFLQRYVDEDKILCPSSGASSLVLGRSVLDSCHRNNKIRNNWTKCISRINSHIIICWTNLGDQNNWDWSLPQLSIHLIWKLSRFTSFITKFIWNSINREWMFLEFEILKSRVSALDWQMDLNHEFVATFSNWFVSRTCKNMFLNFNLMLI